MNRHQHNHYLSIPDELDQQMVDANELLGLLTQFIDPEAIIAGGAPREWYLYCMARDLDIYLSSPLASQDNKVLGATIKAMIPDFEPVAEEERYPSENYEDVNFTIEALVRGTYKGQDVELIFIEATKKVLYQRVMAHVDTGLNKAFVKAARHESYPYLNTTKEFIKDMEDDTLTFYPSHMTTAQLVHSVHNHLPKMLDYFPDRKFKIDRPKAVVT